MIRRKAAIAQFANVTFRSRGGVMSNSVETSQAELVAFLSNGSAYGGNESVQRLTTHISHVFLVGDRAYKLKRAVKLPYLDFSTPALRRAAAEHEVRLNRRTAPELYLGVQPITREPAGKLAIGGTGEAVDWLVVMRRFDQEALLDRMSETGQLEPKMLSDLADAIAALHTSAEPAPAATGAAAMKAIVEGNGESFKGCAAGVFDPERIERLQQLSLQSLADAGPLLDRRREHGKVRRCHGDLHLGNIVVIDGRPTPFDCIEFDDRMAEIDVLYDLAFPLMDLLHGGLGREASILFNRYFDRTQETDGVAALPFFLSVRAAIRAHVAARRDSVDVAAARNYLDLALRLIAREPPTLVAIGGLSGTGKSTLAYRLAPELGTAPGARVLRSDVLRKRIFGVPPEQRLNAAAYTVDVNARVYAALADEASTILRAGHSAILDAVHARPAEREAAREIARAAGVPFRGFWLEAPVSVLEERLAGRSRDASDADVEILRRQLDYDLGKLDWIRLDASAEPEGILAAIRAGLR